MFHIVFADSPLAAWGQIAAILLAIELFVFIIIGLALAAALAFAFAWVREKTELIKKLRPVVDSVNRTTESAIAGTLPPPRADDNKLMRTVAEVPVQMRGVEEKIEQGSDRVAGAVIEFRARTVMVQQMAKAFFLPGLTRGNEQKLLEGEGGPGRKSPGYRTLVEEPRPGPPSLPGTRDGYRQAIASDQLRDAPVR